MHISYLQAHLKGGGVILNDVVLILLYAKNTQHWALVVAAQSVLCCCADPAAVQADSTLQSTLQIFAVVEQGAAPLAAQGSV